VVLGSLLLLFALGPTGCREAASGRREAAPVPVVTGVAVRQDLPELIRAVGAVESISAITLRPQVSGQVALIEAREGQEVEAGSLLIQIDPRPFEAALREAEANRERLRALSLDLARSAELVRSAMSDGAATQREVDAASARADAARAEFDSAEAAVESARLNLEYCEIRAPFPGRLGAALVRRGAIVRANETPLMDLVQVTPIDVAFSIPERHIERVKAGVVAEERPVSVTLPGSSDPLAGTLWFVDNRIDETTGQVRLRARFENEDARLWPGQFANVHLEVGVDRSVVLVPSRAVQRSQSGSYVFVVDGEARASMRPVTVRRTQEGVAVIDTGLDGGETIITEGQLRVVPGARVAVRGEPTASASLPTGAPRDATDAAGPPTASKSAP